MQRHNTARPTARLRARAAAACIAVVVTSVGVTACGPGRPDPDTAAQALADGISSGDLADVPLSGSTPTAAGAQLAAAIAGLDPLRPAIVVGQIAVDDKGEAAEAPLAFTWDVDDGDQDWTYSTTAHLDLVEDEWVAQWSLSVVSPDLVPGLVLATHRVAAERANVLGADGVALVEPRPVLRLGVDKTRVDAAGQPEAARQVAELLGLDPGPYAERVAAAGVRAFVEALVVRTENPGVDLVAFAGIAGALSVEDVIPLSPSRRFARPILGAAGPATTAPSDASMISAVAGDTAGLSGLQLQYDAQLRGRPGLAIVVLREDTGDERELFHLDPVPGEPLVTTLDPRFQDAAESVLEPWVKGCHERFPGHRVEVEELALVAGVLAEDDDRQPGPTAELRVVLQLQAGEPGGVTGDDGAVGRLDDLRSRRARRSEDRAGEPAARAQRDHVLDAQGAGDDREGDQVDPRVLGPHHEGLDEGPLPSGGDALGVGTRVQAEQLGHLPCGLGLSCRAHPGLVHPEPQHRSRLHQDNCPAFAEHARAFGGDPAGGQDEPGNEVR